MGSVGTHRLTDYTGQPKQPTGAGGTSGQDRCAKAFSSQVEEVDRCDYVKVNGQPPAVGTEVKVVFDRRPAVVTINDVLIGYLPTQFNYLRACIEAGFSYAGVVTDSKRRPVASVTVDIQPL